MFHKLLDETCMTNDMPCILANSQHLKKKKLQTQKQDGRWQKM